MFTKEVNQKQSITKLKKKKKKNLGDLFHKQEKKKKRINQ